MLFKKKKYLYISLLWIIVIWGLTYWTYRIITQRTRNEQDYENDNLDIKNNINIFDTTKIHEINISINEDEYKNMIDTYANTSEKDWHKANIIMDWVTINNVWIRLKWEESLSPIKQNSKDINYNLKLPFLIKFNKYAEQTYQWHEMISLRIGLRWSDPTILSEPYTYELYQALWQPSPDTSYGSVQINWKDAKLFIISEIPEDKYFIEKWFWDDNWILFKAWNFVDFVYLWEDPTLYSNNFKQKTRKNDYDLTPLIKMLSFITEANNEEFEQEINKYIDINSVITLLAIDTFIWNNDSFGGVWSNYYLYYHLWKQKFYILTWDQNLALWIAWNGPWWYSRWYPIRQEIENYKQYSINYTWRNNKETGWWVWNNNLNVLKRRILANEKFKKIFYDTYENIEKIALDTDFSEKLFEEWSNTLLDYNKKNQLIPENAYKQWVAKLKNYLENMKRYRIQTDFSDQKTITVND